MSKVNSPLLPMSFLYTDLVTDLGRTSEAAAELGNLTAMVGVKIARARKAAGFKSLWMREVDGEHPRQLDLLQGRTGSGLLHGLRWTLRHDSGPAPRVPRLRKLRHGVSSFQQIIREKRGALPASAIDPVTPNQHGLRLQNCL
ncbi:hypothetical protein BHM03_00002774 [Ensete ventricosum]|nr:hypothetical protein BHM03_00002774 [Ensete ventricosum]